MTTFNASLATNRAATPQAYNKGNQQDGELRIFRSVWNDALTQALNIADVISWGFLPKGAVIVGGYLSYTAGTAACTINLGDPQSAARYLAATAVNAAGNTPVQPPVNIGLGISGGYEIAAPSPGSATDDSEVRSVVAGAGSPATQRIVLVLFYVANN